MEDPGGLTAMIHDSAFYLFSLETAVALGYKKETASPAKEKAVFFPSAFMAPCACCLQHQSTLSENDISSRCPQHLFM